jgi:LysM repeat protein
MPKVGAWKCYTVKAGDTLTSVATGSKSLVQNAGTLKSYNLEILYGDDTLYPGQQLRLPIHICFEDETSDCHIVKAKETLASIAKTYNTSAYDLCRSNADILLRQYQSCDNAIVVGMELVVPTLRPAQPFPCKEIPGYWSCYAVKANDILGNLPADECPKCRSIAMIVGISLYELEEVNFGKNRSTYYCGDCSNTTECHPGAAGDQQRGPACLRIGQVLTVPVAPACVSRP